MPVHDWSRVDAGIFHDFHGEFIRAIKWSLNHGLLPGEYYAMMEQRAAGVVADVLALQKQPTDGIEPANGPPSGGGTGLLLEPPAVEMTDEADQDYYRRKRNTVVVRHVSDDRVVAMIEVVSPGNKSSQNGLKAFVEKAADLLEKRIHLLVVDLHAPGPRDPHGIHAAIWEEYTGKESPAPDKPFVFASYDADFVVRAFVKTVTVGEPLPAMPLFLMPRGHIVVPLEAIYEVAYAEVPRGQRRLLEAK
jgi:hypothetical protein